MKEKRAIPPSLQRLLAKLGNDLRDARRRRRIPSSLMAARASINRATLTKMERGDPSVSFGAYARLLFALGLADRLGELADVRKDDIGLSMEEENLPQRIRLPKLETD